MKRNLTPVREEPVKQDQCKHYWVIESPKGSTSSGLCKYCGAKREFYNSWPFFLMGKQMGATEARKVVRPRKEEKSGEELEEEGPSSEEV